MRPSAKDLLSATEAAAYIQKSRGSFDAFRCRRRKLGRPVPEYRIGALVFFDRVDLDALFVKAAQPSKQALNGAFGKVQRTA